MQNLPTWFRAKLMEARSQYSASDRRRASYEDAGYHLGIHWPELIREDDDEWELRRDLKQRRDEVRVLDWLSQHLSDFVRVVPSRRRKIFARGFLAGALK